MKFKVGDRVCLILPYTTYDRMSGTVIAIDGENYQVKFDCNRSKEYWTVEEYRIYWENEKFLRKYTKLDKIME